MYRRRVQDLGLMCISRMKLKLGIHESQGLGLRIEGSGSGAWSSGFID